VPTESELRDLLQGGHGDEPRLDADRIIRRARARRRPKRMAVGALGGLAAVAIVVPMSLSLGSTGPGTMSASDEAGSLAASPEEAHQDSRLLEQDVPASCQPALWEGEPAPAGLTLRFAQEVAGGELTLTVVNGSTDAVTGTLPSAPALLLARDGVIIGDSTPALSLPAIDLAPGEQLILTVPLEAVDCTGAPLEAGSYEGDVVLAIRDDAGRHVILESGFGHVAVSPAH
jgi:hypothetical protein